MWESGWAGAMPRRWAETDGPGVPLGLAPAEPGDGPQVEEGERESCQGYEGKEVSSDVEEKWHFRPPALAPCEPAGEGHCRALCSLFFCSVRVIIPDRSQGDIPHKNGCKALC